MKTNKYNITLIFLGNYHFDARCTNMINTFLKQKYKISILYEKNLSIKTSAYNINEYCVELPPSGIYKYLKFHFFIKKTLCNIKSDIIIACDLFSLSAICNFKQSKLIYDCREIYSELFAHNQKPFHKIFWTLYEKYYIKYIDEILFTAKSDHAYNLNVHPSISTKKCHIIKNFPAYLPYIGKTKLLHNKLSISTTKKIILYQGVVQSGRGISQLINLVIKSDKYVAVIIGPGDKNQFRHLAQTQKAQDKVFFIGPIPYIDLLHYTASADIGWLMIKAIGISNKLALPNKLFEYILMGLPVISSNIQNISELIHKYNLGVVVSNDSTFTDYNKALNLIYTKNLSSIKLHNTAKQNFIWENQIDLLINIIIDDKQH